ncbi:MAG: hypothetical protein ACT4OO_12875 [Nitrospiraceae bacterium]
MQLKHASMLGITLWVMSAGCATDARDEVMPEGLLFQHLPTQTLRLVTEDNSNLSPAFRDEIGLVRQGMQDSIARRGLALDATVGSQSGEMSGVIGHPQDDLVSLMGQPISEAVVTEDLSTMQYLSSKLATKQLRTCMVLYGITRQDNTVLNRKIRCE